MDIHSARHHRHATDNKVRGDEDCVLPMEETFEYNKFVVFQYFMENGVHENDGIALIIIIFDVHNIENLPFVYNVGIPQSAFFPISKFVLLYNKGSDGIITCGFIVPIGLFFFAEISS